MKISYKLNGIDVNFEVTKKRCKNAYIRAKDDGFNITCPLSFKDSDINNLIVNHQSFIIKYLPKEKENIIHVLGKAYKPKLIVATKNAVFIDSSEIIIASTDGLDSSYQKSLDKYYQNILKEVLIPIIEEAKNDYLEIKFPTVKLAHLKRAYGNYSKSKNLIKLAILLAKYDPIYIKSVLYHELTHVFEMNHSNKFYNKYEEKFANCRKIQKELKQIKYNDLL